MKILVLGKRQYTGMDLIDDRYGRLFEVPFCLAGMGNIIHGVACSYRSRYEFENCKVEPGLSLEWDSLNGYPFSPISGRRYLRRVSELIRDFMPDVVWASSDAWHAFAAQHVCTSLGIPYVVDLYDNYESFGLTKVPGVRGFLRRACRHAAGITVVTNVLADYIESNYSLGGVPVRVIGNAANGKLFFPRPTIDSRLKLGLPLDVPLIGTAGALYGGRDIETLFKCVDYLHQEWPALKVVVAGPRDRIAKRYIGSESVMDLGVLRQGDVPYLLSALDVGVICNRDSDFGRYCYPQKYSEMLACGLPVVSANVGELPRLLKLSTGRVYTPGSPRSLAESIGHLLRSGDREVSLPATWEQRSKELFSFLSEVTQ